MKKCSFRIPFISKQVYNHLIFTKHANVDPVHCSFSLKYLQYLFSKHDQTPTAWKTRNCTILKAFIGDKFRIHKGKLWRMVTFSEWHVGSKFGSIAKTKQLVLFRQKLAKKKKPVVKNTFAQVSKQANIEKIKQIKSGLKAKNANNLSLDYEQQLSLIV